MFKRYSVIVPFLFGARNVQIRYKRLNKMKNNTIIKYKNMQSAMEKFVSVKINI